MMLVKTKLIHSGIHGLGCFADEDIEEGQTVWRLDPGIDLIFTEEQFKTLPEAFQLFLKKYCYCPSHEKELQYILCVDHARHLNHSENPNLSETPETNYANRKIKKGEELTCNYLVFDRDADYKLKHDV